MPAAVAIPLIIGAGQTVASLAGAKMASNSAKGAAKIQTDASNQAARRQDQATQQALGYYQQSRGASNPARDRLGAMFNFQSPQQQGAQPLQMGPHPMQGGSQSMVTIQAPTGQTKQVPASQAQHYIQRGGKVVG